MRLGSVPHHGFGFDGRVSEPRADSRSDLFGDDFKDRWREKDRGGIPLSPFEGGENLRPPRGIASTQFKESRNVCSDKASGPVPKSLVWQRCQAYRPSTPNGKSAFSQQLWQCKSDVRFAALFAPALVDRVDEITEFRLWGQQLVTAVHGIFVKNCCSALAKASSEAINKHANIRHEAGNPTAPHGIKPRERERRVHEVRFDAVDIGIRAVSCFASEILEESDAAFDRKHPSRRPDKPREIKCSESRSRSDVCDCRPQSDSCRSPGCVDLIAPDLVLKSKPIDFGVVRSKNIVAFPLSHGAGRPGIQV